MFGHERYLLKLYQQVLSVCNFVYKYMANLNTKNTKIFSQNELFFNPV